MSNKTLARPYAQAAFDYAKTHDVIPAWQDALGTWKILAENRDIQLVADAPGVPKETFEDLLASFVSSKKGEPLRNFLQVVLEHDRFFVMPDIAALFIELHNDSDTIIPVSVTSAIALSDAEKAKIVERMEAKTDQKVTLTCDTDPALLGGFVIRYDGDKVIDASLKNRLTALAHSLID